ncbi:MAG: 40S ribosomal protein S19 [archaeon]|nr:40S ribosomal protein S19 [archaeon]
MAATHRPSITVKDVNPDAFVKAYAAHLKKSGTLELPKWVDLVKTGPHRENAPIDPDWYYIRAASVARRIYIRGGTGVGALTGVYGAASKGGVRCSHHQKAARGVIRSVIKQLEAQGILRASPKGGRSISSKGRKELDLIAATIA